MSTSSSSSMSINTANHYAFMDDLKHSLLGPTMAGVIHSIASLVRHVTSVVKPFFEMAAEVKRGVAGLQFTVVLFLPMALQELAENIWDMIFKRSLEHKMDHFFGAVAAAAESCGVVADVAEALVAVGGAAVETLAWASPLCLGAACVGSVFWVIHGRGIYHGDQLLDKLNDASIYDKTSKEVNVVNLKALLSKKSHKYHLSHQLGINADKVLKRIQSLETTLGTTAPAAIQQLYKGLKGRIDKKMDAHILGSVVALVGIVASVILFVATGLPAVIAGCSLLGILCILGMVKAGVEVSSKWKFDHLLKA